jgi:hypothetical protein
MPGQSPVSPPAAGAVVESVPDGVVVVEGVVVVDGVTTVPPSVAVEGVVVVAAAGVVVALLPELAAYALLPPISAPAMPTSARPFLRCIVMCCLLRRVQSS